MRARWLVARLIVWKWAWFEPLLLLHQAGVIDRDEFEEAVMAPLRHMR